MKGGKDDEKQLDPLFPRIHINDAEKGGPRAPPRNKMALCEQLTLPSNKFTSGSMSMLPLPPGTGTSNSVAPSSSSSHVSCHKKSMFTPYCSFQGSSDLAVRPHHPHVSGALNYNNMSLNPELRSLASLSYQTFNTTGHFPMTTNNLFPPLTFLSARNPTTDKINEQDRFKVPRFTHSQENTEKLNPKFSYSLQIPYEKRRIETNCMDFKDIEYMGKLAEDNIKASTSLSKVETFTRKRSPSPSKDVSLNESSEEKSDGLSAVDSSANFIISPDYVVGIIGQKQFWEARRIILHQQRIFGLQIFELHRLIKVQKLMAESPGIIFEDKFCLGKPSIKKSIPENIQDSSEKVDTKQNINLESSEKDNETHKVLNNEESLSSYPPQKLISLPSAADIKLAPLVFQPPPGNQWLIPVRSPSEGLIYKPYNGPFPPPSAAFMGPVYGGPISLPGTNGNFLNPGYNVSSSNQQHGIGNFSNQSYFQSLPMPPVLSVGPSSLAIEAKPRTIEHEISETDTSLNLPNQKSWIEHMQVTKGSDQASSEKGNALPLFPTMPSINVSHQNVRSLSPEKRVQVIKVVPHDRKSASESTARILRTIQEERKQQYG